MSPATVSDRVFGVLCEAIVSGSYTPGEKLPTQRALAADLGVNIGPVREAVKRLEQLRLVTVRHGDAMRVADWRATSGLEAAAPLLFRPDGFDPQALRALMEARRVMLAQSARFAAERRSDEQAAELERLADSIAHGIADPAAVQALDFAFFAELIDAAGNLVFSLVMNSIKHLYLENARLFSALVESPEELAPLYRRAARAVAAGSPARAARAVDALAALQEERVAG
jgi:GntR family transcriptional regulator, transcriptional repressor for pyruvate dehydrogenase complex